MSLAFRARRWNNLIPQYGDARDVLRCDDGRIYSATRSNQSTISRFVSGTVTVVAYVRVDCAQCVNLIYAHETTTNDTTRAIGARAHAAECRQFVCV